MIHLKGVVKSFIKDELLDEFPFNTKIIKALEELKIDNQVCIFTGENGSGKSTLLEGIAAGCNLPIIGSRSFAQDETLKNARKLAEHLKLVWTVKSSKGFFLRAEDFFGFTKYLNFLKQELYSERNRLENELPDGYGKQLAVGAINSQISDMQQRYGIDLDASSHGESFLKLFQSRIKPNGLYLLDEPETPLSPIRQMALMRIISDAVKEGGQFIIITHSPILMAYPNAKIFDFNSMPPKVIEYDQIEHVRIFKDFLNNPEVFLRNLMN